ncbi:MAG: universal stress protein [Sphingomonadaceae bacterium]|jgi:nucleotide-binding universal stress UspA family protein
MRSILTSADRKPGLDARIETALSLVRANDGHLTVLVDTPVARYVSMDPMGGNYVASDAMKQALADDDQRAKEIEERLSREGVPFDVVRSEAEPIDALAELARLSDLVVLSKSGGLAGELALVTRTPVLALGDDKPLAVPPAKVCVAWDGGDEAALALRTAAPMLAQSEQVEIVTVTEKAGGFPATDACRYLSRHGVKAELQELERRGSAAETLAVAVARLGAELVVMGAFGHSRVREYIFGGVTRTFLEDAEGPALFLAH